MCLSDELRMHGDLQFLLFYVYLKDLLHPSRDIFVQQRK